MAPEDLMALWRAMNDEKEKAKTLLVLLYEVVERTGRQAEGFYSLRLINDVGNHGEEELPSPEVDPEGHMRGMYVLLRQVCDTIGNEIERLDV